MKLDTGLYDATELGLVPAAARAAEDAGYNGAWSNETKHDPFFPLVLATEHTSTIDLGTSIAIAFSRSPMVLANIGWDLQTYSKGRFILGLGSQVKPHIIRRFSMPWSKPASRMREYILALRAIWTCWNDGTELDFDGEFYKLNLMTPYFDPGPQPYGPPKVFLAAVGSGMMQVAGEVADGAVLHAFTTERYIAEVVRPALEAGFKTSGRDGAAFELKLPLFVVTGRDEQEMKVAADAIRGQVAFYASTPAYRGVLELHGWGALQDELHALTRAGEWDRMGSLIDDEVLDTFAVVAEPDEVGRVVRERYGDLVDRVSFNLGYEAGPDVRPRMLASFRA